jgi:putative proteasome-type protease
VQAIVNMLTQRTEDPDNDASLGFNTANLVSNAMRETERRDGASLEENEVGFISFSVLDDQTRGEAPRLFRVYAECNFIEAGLETLCIPKGEAKCGKALIDSMIMGSRKLADATQCILVSFDSTLRSISMAIGRICCERDGLECRRFHEGDAYSTSPQQSWSEGTRQVSGELPGLVW